MKTGTIVTVLDVGSSKVCCCITSIAADGRFTILGTGYCACFGVKAGIISDMRAVEKSVSKALEMAENAANFRVKSVYTNISGCNARSDIVSSSLMVGGKVVQKEDIVRLISMNKSEDEDYSIVHAIPILFSVDAQRGVKNPVGMLANELKMISNVVLIPREQINNISECLDRCHLELSGIVLSCYASGLCVFEKEFRNNIVVDFGAGTTSIAFFYDGIFCGADIIPLGGNNITSDIAFGLDISKVSAERIKTLYGAAFVSMDDSRESICVPVQEESDTINLRRITKDCLNAIIQPRVEEILCAVRKKIDDSVLFRDFADSCVIITGGGSQLTGLRDFANSVLGRTVILRQANNHGIDSNIQVDNDFSVIFGMIKFSQMIQKEKSQRRKNIKHNRKNFIEKIRDRLKNNW